MPRRTKPIGSCQMNLPIDWLITALRRMDVLDETVEYMNGIMEVRTPMKMRLTYLINALNPLVENLAEVNEALLTWTIVQARARRRDGIVE